MPATYVPKEDELSPNTEQTTEKLATTDYGAGFNQDFSKFEDQAGPSNKSNFGKCY